MHPAITGLLLGTRLRDKAHDLLNWDITEMPVLASRYCFGPSAIGIQLRCILVYYLCLIRRTTSFSNTTARQIPRDQLFKRIRSKILDWSKRLKESVDVKAMTL
jgi:hypothetical protein